LSTPGSILSSIILPFSHNEFQETANEQEGRRAALAVKCGPAGGWK